ncbi:hypothetical protein [Sideroxydans sp. CL21]|nr:hypothetical protein [Sideroxydans sp. CL21]
MADSFFYRYTVFDTLDYFIFYETHTLTQR